MAAVPAGSRISECHRRSKRGYALIRKLYWLAPAIPPAKPWFFLLASQGAKVWMVVRRFDLSATMSRYLIDRINGLANVEVVTDASISGLEGHGGMLEGVRWRIGATGEEVRRAINHLFLFIGAEPNSIKGSGISLDTKGFVLTGDDAGAGRHTLETTRRGVFAIGDVRAKSVKRDPLETKWSSARHYDQIRRRGSLTLGCVFAFDTIDRR
jgi:thioredoxin reductase